MKHERQHIGQIKHRVELTPEEVDEAIKAFVRLRQRLTNPPLSSAMIVDYDTGCCSLSDVTVTWTETVST